MHLGFSTFTSDLSSSEIKFEHSISALSLENGNHKYIHSLTNKMESSKQSDSNPVEELYTVLVVFCATGLTILYHGISH